jgi:predicted transcriptional regulator
LEATKSLFLEALGDSPYLRVLDHFLTFPGWDYSKSQVAKDAQVSRVTLEPIWKRLLDIGFIEKTRTMGRSELYRLNAKNPKVRVLMEVDEKLSEAFAQTQAPLKQKITIKRK